MLTPAQVADRLQVSMATVYRMIWAGQLPAIQLHGAGSSCRISADEFERWLDESKVVTK